MRVSTLARPMMPKIRCCPLSTPLRKRIILLWDEVTEYNRDHASDITCQVTFYCGQYLVEEEESG